jgi:hypothetical protein
LFARQWGWLGSVPKESKKSRLETIRNPSGKLSLTPEEDEAAQALLEIHLPKIYPAYDFLRGLFFDMGQATSTGMGIVPISWEELRAFRLENDLDLGVWERQTLKKMSEAYCAEYSLGTEPGRPAPYAVKKDEDEVNVDEELAKAKSWRAAIRRNAKKS